MSIPDSFRQAFMAKRAREREAQEVAPPFISAFDEKEIFKFVQEKVQEFGLKFAYAEININLEEFSPHYVSQGWLGRKIIALPAAVLVLAAKSIYHLAKIFFFFQARSDCETYVKAQLFCIGRDFQEAFGWLISVFNDRYGQYHIDKSQFYKACYDCLQAPEMVIVNLPFSPPSDQARNSEEDLIASFQHELGNGNYPAALGTIEKIQEGLVKEGFYVEIAQFFLQKGLIDDALNAAGNIFGHKINEKAQLLEAIADGYLKLGQPVKAQEAMHRIGFDRPLEKNAVVEKLVQYYLDLKKPSEAQRVVHCVTDPIRLKSLYIQICDNYIEQGKKSDAERLLRYLEEDSEKQQLRNKIEQLS